MTRRALVFCSLVGLAACAREPSGPSNPVGPDLAISNAGNGGSPDFFWRPPIANGGGGTGTFNPNLNITVKVCETVSPTVCASPVFEAFNVPVVTSQYQTVWAVPVSGVTLYRIFVIIEGTSDVVIAFADVHTAANKSQLKNVNPNAFVPITDGSNLPIKFRIEGHCTNTPCGESYIDLDQGGFAYAKDPSGVVQAGIHIPGGNGPGIVTATIEPCAGGDLPVDIPLFGGCSTVNTNPEIVGANALTVPGQVFICEAKPDIEALPSEEQEEKATIHRKHDNDPVQALPHDLEDCNDDQVMDDGSVIVLSFRGMLRALAQGRIATAGKHLLGLLGPQPLHARRLDAGAGGRVFEFSDFQFGLPSKMEQYFSEGPSLAAITIQVQVTDLDWEPVANARVHFAAAAGNGSVADAVVLSDPNGIASTTWTLPEGSGPFQATAKGVGLADPDNNGPRTGGTKCEEGDCYFDPFMAIQNPAFNDSFETETGPIDLEEGVVTFTASTCSECSVGSVTGTFGVKRFDRVLLPQPKRNGQFKPGAIKR